MKIRMLAIGMILGAALAMTAGSALSQNSGGSGGAGAGAGGGRGGDGGKGGAGVSGAGAPGEVGGHKMPTEADMAEMMKAMMPGDMHKEMAKGAGTWDTVTKIWMAGPDMPPAVIKGTTEVSSILDGRFLLEKMSSKFPMPDGSAVPWEGMGMFGYDNYQKMFVGCWADSMGTQLLTMRGSMSPDGKTLTMYGEMDEPMMGVRGRMNKYVTQFTDDDHHVFSIYDLHVGDNHKMVEVAYSRKK